MSAHSTIEFIDAVATDGFGKMNTMEFKYDSNIVDPTSGESTSRENGGLSQVLMDLFDCEWTEGIR